jgi:hypothetical protein
MTNTYTKIISINDKNNLIVAKYIGNIAKFKSRENKMTDQKRIKRTGEYCET